MSASHGPSSRGSAPRGSTPRKSVDGASIAGEEGDARAGAGVRMRQTLVLALAAVLAVVMLVLGIWQMSVYRTQGTRVLQQRADRAPVSLDAQLAQGQQVGSLYGLQVRLHGSYLAQQPVLVGTAPPYRVVSPFRDGQRIIGVVRGTVPSATASIPPAPSGTIDQTGILLPSEGAGGSASTTGTAIQPTMNLERFAQAWPSGVLAGFVTLSASDSRAQKLGVQTVHMPDNATGRAQNLGYAMQWWVFAIFAIGAGVAVARSMGRRSSNPRTTGRGAGRSRAR